MHNFHIRFNLCVYITRYMITIVLSNYTETNCLSNETFPTPKGQVIIIQVLYWLCKRRRHIAPSDIFELYSLILTRTVFKRKAITVCTWLRNFAKLLSGKQSITSIIFTGNFRCRRKRNFPGGYVFRSWDKIALDLFETVCTRSCSHEESIV